MSRIAIPETAFRTTRQRRPREKKPGHLDFIRSLPCLICGQGDVHAAHIRAGNLALGKRPTGAGEKPSDGWAVPLCGDHHVWGPDAQHGRGEMAWWDEHRIDPFVTALALWMATGDYDTATTIVARSAAH